MPSEHEERPEETPTIDHDVRPGALDKTVPNIQGARPIEGDRRERYRLVHVLARGGLGTVWVARDDDLNRDIALKELQDGSGDRVDALDRFLREAQITGQLEHPNIVPVYALGKRAEDGQPFYTMRLVRGQTMWDAIVAYHRHRREQKVDPLELRRLLSAFIDVCQALAYAHARGVLHRDLKPENILLGEFGEVIVLDWGLAKLRGQEDAVSSLTLTDSGRPTETMAGLVLGTPAYMSPEQAQGRLEDMDARTDVYGLGAILFDIITGRPPHPGEDPYEIVSRIAHEATPRARAVRTNVPPALDAICARAMAFESEKRYASAKELAADIERWLASEPVSVYPEPLGQRLLRWARKHRSIVVGTAVLLLTAVLALGAGLVVVSREQERTLNAQARAEANFQKARQAVDRMLRHLAQERLNDVPHMEQVRQSLLQEALLFYQDFLTRRSDDPNLRFELAQAQQQLGDIQRMLGDHKTARGSYDAAIFEFSRLARELPARPDYRKGLAGCENARGELLREMGQPAEAIGFYRRAQEIQQTLVSEHPDELAFAQELSRTDYNLGLALQATNNLDEADQVLRKAVDMLKPIVSQHPTTPIYRQDLARAYLKLGVTKKALKREAEAEQSYDHALELYRELVKHSPFSREYQHELASAYVDLGNLLRQTRSADAEKAYREALRIFSGLTEDFPFIPVYRRDLANCRNSLGGLFWITDRKPDAEQAWEQAAKIYEELTRQFPKVPEYQGLLAGTLGNLASIRLKADDLDNAKKLLDRAVHHQRLSLEDNPRNPTYRRFLRNHQLNLAEVNLKQKNHVEAMRSAEEAGRLSAESVPHLVQAAGLLARCLPLVEADTGLTPAQRQEQQRVLKQRVLTLLRAASTKGYKDAAALKKSPDFAPLADDETFRKLLLKMME